jgi:hypothetical protein
VSHKKLKKVLFRVKPEKSFVLVDGKKIGSLPELAIELDTMSDDVFYHHVNEMKNDFANWVRDVFMEPSLAEELIATKDKKGTELCIMRHIVRNLR